MSSRYHIRFYVPDDRDALEDLYRAVYGESWRERTCLGWTLDQPLTVGGATVTVDGKSIVAAQPYCDFPLHTPWGKTLATLFLDVATHPAYRRQGLFRRVVAAARTAAFERGSSIIMTTPNRTASQGFQSMHEWGRLCSLDCLFLPLATGDRATGGGLLSLGARAIFGATSLLWKGPPGQGARSVSSKYHIESPWSPGADSDELWCCAKACAGIMVIRDRAFLQWRFGSDYRLFLARGVRGPAGYAAARVISRAGLRIGMVLDCVTGADETSALPLLAAVVAWLREQGASAAMGYFIRQSTSWHQAREAGFLRLSRPFMPREYPVCASVRPDDPRSVDLLNPSHWYISLADSDLA